MKIRFVLYLLLLGFSVPAIAADRPNVLFIAVDDLRTELGTYGTKAITPNFDQLADSGIRFDRAYCVQAVCGASRLAIMGGLYPTKTKEQTYHVDGWRERFPDLLTLQQHFGNEGYSTVGLGKIYHGASGKGVDPDNWGKWIKIAAPQYALEENNDAVKLNRQKEAKLGIKRRSKAKGPTTESADVADDFYVDGKRADEAVKQLGKLAAGEKPFFLAVGFTKPHLPFVAPKRYWDLYERDSFSLPDNISWPPGYPDFARNVSAGEMRAYSDYEGKRPTDFSDDLNKRLIHGYHACVSYTDANLGKVLAALKANKLEENTIVVLWGDHGWKLGDHSSWCKHTNFECDARVPLIFRVPGSKAGAGKSTKTLVELIDLYPTLCELSDLPVPEHCQGKSFAPLFDDLNWKGRDSAYSSYPHGKMIGHSIRFGKYRYTEWADRKTGKGNGRVLTNLVADPGEETNLIDDPAHAGPLKRAHKILTERVDAALK